MSDEIYKRARLAAAQRETSVSALVRDFLTALADGESAIDRLKREERALRERITQFRASDRMARDDAHRRGS